MSLLFSLCFLYTVFSINVCANSLTKHLNQTNLIKIHGKHVKVDSCVPITWKTFGNTSIQFGLVEQTGDGSEYEAKVIEEGSSKYATLLYQKAALSEKTNVTSDKSVRNSYYKDEFARSTMLPLAAAAYSDRPEICLKNIFENVALYKNVNMTCDMYGRNDICAGYTGVSHANSAIVIAFRGTNAFSQLVVETSQIILKEQMESPVGGKVGYYFADVFNKLWFNHSMEKDFATLQQTYPDYDLWLTGHSLGGALASLAAAQIVADGRFNVSKIKLYTFGQPRTGDVEYANALDLHLLAENTYRITHSRDPIVHLPPHMFYNYTHNKAEVWYSNDMSPNKTYSLCDEHQESTNCSSQIEYIFHTNDHLHYFNKHVSNYGRAGCISVETNNNSWWSWFG